jgi:TrmH RNA methyltransferase
LNQCDVVLTLPGSGAVQSLNVAATAAIIAHALRRR